MLTLYHAATTRSLRIRWLLEELGLPYEMKTLDFYTMERHDPEYRKINPYGSFPAIKDGDIVLTESGAIINYILRKYGGGRFLPAPGSREEAMVDEWMFWSEGLFAVHQRYYWDHCAPPPACIIDPIPSIGVYGARQAIKYALPLEQALGSSGFAVGDDLTAADFMLCFPLYLADVAGWFETLPNVRAYVARIAARPAFQMAIDDLHQRNEQMVTSTPEFPSFRTTESVIWPEIDTIEIRGHRLLEQAS